MNPGDAPSLRTLFVEAIEIADEAARAAYLDQRCAVGTSLRAQVDALVRAHDLPGGFLPEDPPGPMSGGTPWPEEGPGTVIGPYRLREKLGEGGWGVVHVADQLAPVRRTVALKLIKPGMDTRHVLARFELERRALALMEHPNIATVLDAGTTVRGRPFFVMERVQGERITSHCDRRRLGLDARIRLFLHVCNAVQHAHQKGVIHRDLKPSNILVAERDGVAIPKVIDFGIAKSVAGPDAEETASHSAQAFLGTPAYVSPEQLNGGFVDTRSDLYSLGVLLYELLAGSTPSNTAEWLKSGIETLRRNMAMMDPPSPSQRVQGRASADAERAAADRATTPTRWASALRGDLDAVVMKCLEKDPSRRYATVHELALDLARHLAGEPVLARPAGTLRRLGKWARRHRVPVAAGAGVVMAWLAASALSAVAWRREVSARAAESVQRDRAEQGEQAARRAGYLADMNLALVALERNQLGRVRDILARSAPPPGAHAPDLRHWEWRWLQRMSRGDAIDSFDSPGRAVLAMVVTRDGHGVMRDADGAVHVHSWNPGEMPSTIHAGGAPRALAVSEDGQLVAWARRGPGGRPFVDVWKADARQQVLSRPVESAPVALAVSAVAGRLALFQSDATVRLHDIGTGKELAAFAVSRPDGMHQGVLAFAPDGRVLAWGGTDGWLHLLDAGSLRVARSWEASREGITALAFHPDGSRIATGAGFSDSTIRVWDVSHGQPSARMEGHASWVSALAWSPDGRRLASASADQTVRIHDMGPGGTKVAPAVQPPPLRGHRDAVHALAWSPDGQRLHSGGMDGRVLSWDPARERTEGGHELAPLSVASFQFLPGHDQLVAAGWDGSLSVCLLPHAGPMTVESIGRFDGSFAEVALSADGSRVGVGTDTGVVEVWDIRRRRRLVRGQAGKSVPVLLRHQREADAWWVVDGGGGVRRWRADQPMPEPSWNLPGDVVAASLSPDFTSVASVHRDGSLQRFRAVDGRRMGAVASITGACTDVLHAPDGRTLATTGGDGVVRLWDAGTMEPKCPLRGHLQGAWSAAFSPDGRRMATGGHGREAVKLWDPGACAEVGTLRGDGARFFRVRFSPDGRYVAAIARGGALHLWEADPDTAGGGAAHARP